MSLSQPKLNNPCKKFIEFKGSKGIFQYWDKDKKVNVEMSFPIKFIVLDELSTIKGYCDQTQSGIFSTEVHSLQRQPLTVRTFKGGLRVDGMYADIKGRITEMGGKFCKSIYAALVTDKTVELVNFQLTGISFSAWMDKPFDVNSFGVEVGKCTDGKKGAVKYKIPVYESFEISEVLMAKAVEMDKELQKFLSAYESKAHEGVQDDAPEDLDEPKTWKDVTVHQCADSSLIGMKLGELEGFQVEAIYDTFKPKQKNGEYNEKDLILKQALVCWKKEMDELV